jgi:hypothetical protein
VALQPGAEMSVKGTRHLASRGGAPANRRSRLPDADAVRIRRAKRSDLGAWVSGANVAAAGLFAVTITLIGLMVHERRKPIA